MSKEIKSILFTSFLFILFCVMAWEANTFADKAKFFPLFVALGAAFIALLSLILQYFELIKANSNEKSNEEKTVEIRETVRYVLWVVGFIIAIYLIGFMLATVLFLLTFLLFESKFRLFTSIISTGLVIGLLLLFSSIMNLYWPIGLLGWV